MSQRKHINLKTKLASALLALGDIPYEDSKLMSAEQIISLYQFDHGILHSTEPIDEPWNLTPRLIMAHREKSKKDTGKAAKTKRIDKKWTEFTSKVLAKPQSIEKQYKWPKRKLQSRGFR
jgi:hypothetical protein